jgi:DeoR/GlpR family transcriptional regulator of sugar metabolism
MRIKDERLSYIIDVVRHDGKTTVTELSAHFGISDITTRRDLKTLEEQGLIRRAHGGGVYPVEEQVEAPVIQRMQDNRPEKECIARAVAELVDDNDSIFIGSGSTAMHIARHLKYHQELTVVTNAINVVTELAPHENVNLIVLGGLLRASELSMVGHITEQALREVRVDKVIMGIGALDISAGLTNESMPEVMTDRAIIKMGLKLILVADHTKFGRVASAYVAPVERITTLVTDDKTDAVILKQIQEMGVDVIVAR